MFISVKYSTWSDDDAMFFNCEFFNELSAVKNFKSNFPALSSIDDIVISYTDCPFL